MCLSNFGVANVTLIKVHVFKATKIDEIFTVNLTLRTVCQIDGEDLVNFCGLLRKRKLYPSSAGPGVGHHDIVLV